MWWNLRGEALEIWRTCFGRDCGPVAGHYIVNEWMDGWMNK
jgi:hypothetical protein